MPAERFDFPTQGQKLAALLDRPDGPVRAVALFAHCFTCGKSIKAARYIAEGLKQHGIAVLRFDFTGLGGSEGEFANTTFSSNIDDLVAAADHLRQTIGPPAILIGHSLGGAAVLAASHRIDDARAVVTIGAPFDPSHVDRPVRRKSPRAWHGRRSRGLDRRPAVPRPPRFARRYRAAESGRAHPRLAQSAAYFPFADRRHRRHRQCRATSSSRRNIPRASSRSPAPIISSAGTSDAVYIAHVIAAWAERYLDMAAERVADGRHA